jgi:hypothetical protein
VVQISALTSFIFSQAHGLLATYSVATEGSFLWVKAAGVVKLTTDFHLVPKVRKIGDVPSLPMGLHVVIRRSFIKLSFIFLT